MSGHHETARLQSRAAWGAVARGWYAQREELWKVIDPPAAFAETRRVLRRPRGAQRLRHGRSGVHPRAGGGCRLRRTRDRGGYLSLAFRREGCLLALCHRYVVVLLADPAGPFSRSAEHGSGAGARSGSTLPIWRGIRLPCRMPQRRDVLILR